MKIRYILILILFFIFSLNGKGTNNRLISREGVFNGEKSPHYYELEQLNNYKDKKYSDSIKNLWDDVLWKFKVADGCTDYIWLTKNKDIFIYDCELQEGSIGKFKIEEGFIKYNVRDLISREDGHIYEQNGILQIINGKLCYKSLIYCDGFGKWHEDTAMTDNEIAFNKDSANLLSYSEQLYSDVKFTMSFLEAMDLENYYAEGLGNCLYIHLKGNESENTKYKSYLNSVASDIKKITEQKIFSYMNIALSINKNTYKKFLKDFPLFENSSVTREEFEKKINIID